MAILGYNTKGTTARAWASGRMEVSKFTLASSSTLTELHGWFGSGTGLNSVKLVIYDDDGAGGLPGTRLAVTSALLLGTGDTELSQSGFSVSLAAGDYWIGWASEATGGATYGEATGTTHQAQTGAWPTPPSAFGTPTASGTRKHSVWAVVSGGPTVARFSRLKVGSGLTGTDSGGGVVLLSGAFISGTGSPAAGVGVDGAIYLDVVSGKMYGPKAAGAWPATPFGRLLLPGNTYADVSAKYGNYAALLAG